MTRKASTHRRPSHLLSANDQQERRRPWLDVFPGTLPLTRWQRESIAASMARLFKGLFSKPLKPRRALRHDPLRKISIEPLEDRRLLATLSPGQSIQTAIDNAVDGEVITLNDGTYLQDNISIDSLAGKTLTIRAANQGLAIIQENVAGSPADIFIGTTVTGNITFDGLKFVTDTGDSAANGIDINNDFDGVMQVINSTFEVRNDAVNVQFINSGDSTLVFSNNTVTGDVGFTTSDRGVRVQVEDTSVGTVIVTDNTFTNLDEEAVVVDVTDTATANIVIDNNEADNTDTLSVFNVDSQGSSTVSASITNNDVDDTNNHAINIQARDTSTTNLIIQGNVLTNIGDTDNDHAILIQDDSTDGATLHALVDNNQITNAASDGILVEVDAISTYNLVITNNTLTTTNTIGSDGAAGGAIVVQDTTVDASVIKVDLRNNTVSGVQNGFDAYELKQTGGTFNLEQGISGSTDPATVVGDNGNTGTPINIIGTVNVVANAVDDTNIPASLGDFVWEDTDGDGVQDGGEPGVSGVTVALRDSGDTTTLATTITDVNGKYLFPALTPGDYRIQVTLPAAFTGFSPKDAAAATEATDSDVSATGLSDAGTLTGGNTNLDVDAGVVSIVAPPPTFSKVFAPESIIAGGVSTLTFTIDNTANTSAATGIDFTDNLPAGVVIATPPAASTTCTGGTLTTTSGTSVITYTGGSVAAASSCTVTVDVTSSVAGMHVNTTGDLTSSLGNSGTATDTLNVIGLDFGDAPDLAGGPPTGNPYPTLLEHDGARHALVGPFLGASIDPEADGQPSAVAGASGTDGDDGDGNDDEDGVVFTSLLLVGRTTTIDVTASGSTLLNAFVDFGGDGSFAQAGDQIFTNQPLAPGVNKLAFKVPTTVTPGITTFARFRVNSTGGLSYDGFAADGEVEDYQVNISLPLPDRIGVFRLGQNFHLDTTGNGAWNTAAGGDTFSVFGIPSLSGLADGIIGDWDGNGTDDLGLFYENRFYLDTTQNGKWDKTSGGDTFYDFGINALRGTATPVVGDWDGNGTDDVGLYHDGNFYLDTSGNGVWDGVGGGDTFRDFGIGAIRSTAEPVIGDWDGDNADDLGLHNDGFFYLDTSGNGVWDTTGGGDTFHDFGAPTVRATALPIVGDWNNDGTDDLGLFNDPYNFRLDTNRNGTWDGVAGGDTFQSFDPAFSAFPLVGNWNLPGGVLLEAAGGPADAPLSASVLTAAELDPIVDQAIAAWQAAGLNEDQLQTLSNTQFAIANLSGAALGQTVGNTVTIDADAAGYGWFFDETPWEDSEFSVGEALRDSHSASRSDAATQIDLLTAVMHEMGHILGYDHDDHGVMQDELSPGIRRVWEGLGDAWDDEFDLQLD